MREGHAFLCAISWRMSPAKLFPFIGLKTVPLLAAPFPPGGIWAGKSAP